MTNNEKKETPPNKIENFNIIFQLKNRSALAVNCYTCNNSLFVGQLLRRSNHERAARVIYLRTNDRQTVNYYTTIHALERIYFDSNSE